MPDYIKHGLFNINFLTIFYSTMIIFLVAVKSPLLSV